MEFIVSFFTLSKRDSLMVMISLQPIVSHLQDLSIFVLDNLYEFNKLIFPKPKIKKPKLDTTPTSESNDASELHTEPEPTIKTMLKMT